MRFDFIQGQTDIITRAGALGLSDEALQTLLDAFIGQSRFGALSAFDRVRLGNGAEPRDAEEIRLRRIGSDTQTLGATIQLPAGKDGVRSNRVRAYIELKYKLSDAGNGFGVFTWYLNKVEFRRRGLFFVARENIRITSGLWSIEFRDSENEGGWLFVLDNRGAPNDTMNRDAFTGDLPTHTMYYTDDRLRVNRLLGTDYSGLFALDDNTGLF